MKRVVVGPKKNLVASRPVNFRPSPYLRSLARYAKLNVFIELVLMSKVTAEKALDLVKLIIHAWREKSCHRRCKNIISYIILLVDTCFIFHLGNS